MNESGARSVEAGMIRTLIACTLMTILPQTSMAAPAGQRPTTDVSRQLIADIAGIPAGAIKVASVVEGSIRSEDGFEHRVCRITVVHPQLDNGRMVRRIGYYDFSWSEEYGWFHQEPFQAAGGEQVRIWSELKGMVIIP